MGKSKKVVFLREHTGNKHDLFRKNMVISISSEKVPYVRYKNYLWEVLRNPYCEDEYLTCGRMQKSLSSFPFGHKYSEIIYCNKAVKSTKPIKSKVTILKDHRRCDTDIVFRDKLIRFNTKGIPYITHQRLFWELTESDDGYSTTGRVQNVLNSTEFGHNLQTVYTVRAKKKLRDSIYTEHGKDRFSILIVSKLRPQRDELLLKSKTVRVSNTGMRYISHNRILYAIEPNHRGDIDFITVKIINGTNKC
jgi:hypothetical protein